MDIAETLGLEAIRQVPRILGLIDREKDSPTFGCADRYFWHYKLHDFPNARFQEASEVLALAFEFRLPANPFFGKPQIKEWALAAGDYWQRIAHGDGSFDEAYPYERSFCATAFSTLHATETLIRLNEPVSPMLRTIGTWIACHDSPDTANQRAAAAAALANIARLTGDNAFLSAARRRVQSLKEEFTRAGFFNEYGGSDAGYTSITISALSVYAERVADEETRKWVASCADELGRKLKDDGTYDYAGQSRSTRFFYPHALAWSENSQIGRIAKGVAAGQILMPSWMDDRYMIPYAADYLRAASRLSKS